MLGGSHFQVPVIKTAKEMGLHVITCDYLPDNPGHRYADEYYNVSTTDMESVLALARSLHIDGIMSFACDPGVVTAAYVAEKMGLPSAGSYESISILQNKGCFRKFLKDHGFHVPTAKGYTAIEKAMADIDLFHWPVIVKPTDSAGSKGVTRVDDPAELKASIEYALSFSRCKKFIMEDFLQPVGYPSDTDSFSVDGKLEFVSFNCQRFDARAENPYVPSAFSWPASISEEHQKELTSEIQRLITLLGLKTSIYNIEVRECIDGKAYIMECSPRGGGNRLAEVLQYATGVDLITNSVRAAVGEKIVGINQLPYNGAWGEIILHSDKPGIFEDLWISHEIKDHVVEKDLWVLPGTKIGGFSAANEAIGTLVLQFETQEELQAVMRDIKSFIKVQIRRGVGNA